MTAAHPLIKQEGNRASSAQLKHRNLTLIDHHILEGFTRRVNTAIGHI